MSEHTPGMWHLHDMEANVICGPDHLAIADCNARSRTPEENAANVRLIVVAPELLEALRNLVKATYGHEIPDALRRAEAAITKAEGRS